MNRISIRTFEDGDLADVLSVWNRALVRDPISEGRFVGGILCDNDYRPGPDSGFFVATEAGRVIGFLRAIVRHWPNDRVGLETQEGWIPVVAVDPEHQRHGVGTALLEAALAFFRKHDRRLIRVCGRTGSAPGYVFCGVDQEAYPGGLRLLSKGGFGVDHTAVAMSRETIHFDVAAYQRQLPPAPDLQIATLTADRLQAFFKFLTDDFPGDWNTAARAKARSAMGEVLVAVYQGCVVGYCQWEGEHFGPFGVSASLRGRQIGARLFLEAVRRIREADGRSVWFNWADPDAERFYSRFGLTATRHFSIMTKTS